MSQTSASTWMCELQHQGLLALDGPDAERFLQGQVTCDVRELDSRQTRIGLQCDLKGRILTSFRAWRDGDEKIVLRMHRELVDTTCDALGKYAVFFKVTLTNISDAYLGIGIAGPDARSRVEALVGGAPEADGQFWHNHHHRVIQLDPERFECWLAADQAPALIRQLLEHCGVKPASAWQLLDIRAGHAEITPQTRGQFTPQALNYQCQNAISFRKGCYTGQEVVARLHYKAKLKRVMFRCDLRELASLPAPGSVIEYPVAGTLVTAASDGDTNEGLVVAGRDLDSASLLPLPYSLPEEEA
ncbi:CAF17-like 4Fe-4S cluster assembly/insertion protein YgfZ [Marinimicrobium alkaliphilum]|uniref:CAF17-like 4Fe-4S cluster assembly/insertion protein YgfZ n=1 Tax=Marinimicrobium alkaliphilum TaxID=2202654 RepID=UPI000DBA3065|nr:folate-binding protein YgfZ [Marinimicrobium alkaliphilum]